MFKLGIRGSDELHIELDEDIKTKAKCEKHPHGFPIEVNDEDACMVVYRGEGEKLDEDVVVDNISEGKVTLKSENTGETQEYDLG